MGKDREIDLRAGGTLVRWHLKIFFKKGLKMQNMRFLLFFIWKNQIHWEIKSLPACAVRVMIIRQYVLRDIPV